MPSYSIHPMRRMPRILNAVSTSVGCSALNPFNHWPLKALVVCASCLDEAKAEEVLRQEQPRIRFQFELFCLN